MIRARDPLTAGRTRPAPRCYRARSHFSQMTDPAGSAGVVRYGWLRPVVVVCVLAVVVAFSACGGGEEDRLGGAPPADSPSTTATPVLVRPAPGDHELTLIHDGAPRGYLLHAPPTYDRAKPMALVLALHGRPSSASSIRSLTGLSDKADQAGFVVVYPEGVGGGWTVVGAGTDDVSFVSALIDEVERTWGTDPDRIYVTGFSNGAQMTYRLAAALSDRLAAAAPISGAVRSADLVPASPISLITITGTADANVDSMAGEILASWSAAMGCAAPAEQTGDIGALSVTTTRAECDAGAEIVWHSVQGMGHSWPGALTSSPAALSANDIIWEFFAAHRREG